MNFREKLIKCLERVLDGKDVSIDLDELVKLEDTGDKLFNETVHFLEHYVSDADLRIEDYDYNLMQKQEIIDCISRLTNSR